MHAVILAGGRGTRISEETIEKPKPMIEIGGKPILWHIMKIYSAFNIKKFVICLGYKGYLIKEYFANYYLHQSDVTFDLSDNSMIVHHNKAEPWHVTLVDTGEDTMTGGRIKKIKKYVDNKSFLLTYGDGVADIDIGSLVNFHCKHEKLATLTAVQPPGRYGRLSINNNRITSFKEKPLGDGGFVNGGFFVLNPEIFNYIKGDDTVWEQEPLEKLAEDGELMAYQHTGFWQAMDTMRDKINLENLWVAGDAPWKIWK